MSHCMSRSDSHCDEIHLTVETDLAAEKYSVAHFSLKDMSLSLSERAVQFRYRGRFKVGKSSRNNRIEYIKIDKDSGGHQCRVVCVDSQVIGPDRFASPL